MTQEMIGATQPNSIAAMLTDAQNFAAKGEIEKAYKLALEATRKSPDTIQAWFWRAGTAPSLEEKLVCLSRMYALDPRSYHARPQMFHALRELLQIEPYLAYLDETDELYRVKSGLEIYLNVPKTRARQEPYPSPQPNELRSTHVLLLLSAVGLLLGGVGAIVLSPIAAINALYHLSKPLTHRDQVRALVAIVAAGMIWLAALPIGFLLILHVVQ
jgi:hypothetical protein